MSKVYWISIICLWLSVSKGFAQNTENWIWANQYGSNTIDNANSICTDGDNIWLTGYFTNTINFGNGYSFSTLNNSFAMYLLKTDKNGNTLWATCITGDNMVKGIAVTTDNNKNVIVTGITTASVLSISGLTNPNPGKGMVFLIKYDSIGTLIWTKKFINTANCDVSNLCIDKNNNLYIAGNFWGKYLIVDNDTLKNSDTSGTTADAYLIKLNPSGNVVWTKVYNIAQYLNTDVTRNLIVHNHQIFWLIRNQANNQLCILSLKDYNGQIKWSKIFNYYFYSFPSPAEPIIAYQKNKAQLILIGNPCNNNNPVMIIDNYAMMNPFVAFFDTLGNVTNIVNDIYPYCFKGKLYSVFTDDDDNVYLVGTHNNNFTLRGLTISGPYSGQWISMMNDNLNFAYWLAGIYDGGSALKIADLTLDNTKQVYVCGNTGNGTTMYFGNLQINKNNSTNAFLAKIDRLTSAANIPSVSNKISVYPNPSDGKINVKSFYSTTVRIYNSLGDIIKQEYIPANDVKTIDLPNSGMFIIIDERTKQSDKIIILPSK
ncbi:MAG: T9SS type A sorting domain-containing protein [Spirochaetes bacterium]|nr:T9SS type A sorting domain-containing protein [Spirochaetota bacterium]